MELLPLTYTRGTKILGRFTHTQLIRTDKKALYKVMFTGAGTQPVISSYELFRVKEQKATDMTIGGNTVHYEAKEALPGDAMFGKWAWSFTGISEQEAIKKFESLDV